MKKITPLLLLIAGLVIAGFIFLFLKKQTQSEPEKTQEMTKEYLQQQAEKEQERLKRIEEQKEFERERQRAQGDELIRLNLLDAWYNQGGKQDKKKWISLLEGLQRRHGKANVDRVLKIMMEKNEFNK